MPRFADPQKQKAWIEKISKSRKGKCTGESNPSKREDVRQKISTQLKGRDAYWLYGEDNPAKQESVKEKIRNNPNSKATRFQIGHVPVNKGETAETNES